MDVGCLDEGLDECLADCLAEWMSNGYRMDVVGTDFVVGVFGVCQVSGHGRS
jgi:hypothetical protein